MILERLLGAVRVLKEFSNDFSAVRKNRLGASEISHLVEEYGNILTSRKIINSLHDDVRDKLHSSVSFLIENTWYEKFGRRPICYRVHVSEFCDNILHCEPRCGHSGGIHANVLIFSCEPMTKEALETLRDLESRTGFKFDLSLIERKING